MANDDATPEPVSSRRAWQGQESAGGAEARRSRRRFRIIVVTGLLSALATMVVVLISYPRFTAPAAPHFLAINVAEHNRKHFPLQAFARADSDLLMRHFERKKNATTESKKLLLDQLTGLQDKSTEPRVIHLSALALVRDETVYLLPADAEPDSDANWLNVAEVLNAVEKCPAKHKLLILDLAHGLVDPRLGVHEDRVPKTLAAYLEKEKPSFLVLCPCSAGQSSLTSEVLRSSVLAFYLDQGLLGEADVNENGVSVQELFDFIKPRVDRWARNNRGLQQTPALFGTGDFILAPVGRPKLEKTVLAAPDPYPAALLEAWKKRDEAWARGAFAKAARPLLRLEANLLRHESRWRGGVRGEGSAPDKETRDLIEELDKLLSAPPPPPRLLSVLSAKENPAAAEVLFKILRGNPDVKKAPEEVAKILQEDKGAEDSQHARTVVEALSRLAELKQDHLKIAQAVLAGLKKKEPFVEVLYVERLAAFAEREYPETFQMAKIEVLWRTMRAREAVLAVLAREPEFLPWVASAFETADKNRRVAEGKLLWERPGPQTKVWQEAVRDLHASFETYEEVKNTLAGMQTGSAALERAVAELPVHLRVLCDGPDTDALAEQNWLKAAEEAAYLHRFFVAAPDPLQIAAAKLDAHGRDLQKHLDELMRSFRMRIKSAEKADTATAQRQLGCLLQGPRLQAAERADLIKKQRDAAKKLHDETETKDQPASKAADRSAGLMRARMSLGLLRLAGIEVGQPDGQAGKPDLRSPATMEKKLHELWGANGLVKHWRQAPPDRRGLAISRLVSPWDLHTKDEDHGRLWQTKLREEHLHWLKGQFEAESREAGPRQRKADDPRDQEIRDFYRVAAQ